MITAATQLLSLAQVAGLKPSHWVVSECVWGLICDSAQATHPTETWYSEFLGVRVHVDVAYDAASRLKLELVCEPHP